MKKTVKIVCHNESYKRIMLFEDVVSYKVNIHEDYMYIECLDLENNKSSIKCTSFSIIN